MIYYYEDKTVELFNLKDDIGEQRELSHEEVAKKRELYTRLMDWIKKVQAPIPTKLNPDYLLHYAK